MTKPVYFISDLHLPVAASPLRDTFLKFLAGPARSAQALYILGDLFEYWVGDDVGIEAYPAETEALSALTGSGVPVYFQHGNRDLLVGSEFARRTGIHLLPDYHTLDLAGVRALLTHGDLYCTSDIGYQRWRRFARNPVVQAVFLRLPRRWRERFVGRVRAQSTAGKSYKPAEIMDVSEDSVNASFTAHGVTRIIHGHTHRPKDHAYTIDGKARIRTVLSDWRPGRCEALRMDGSELKRIPLS